MRARTVGWMTPIAMIALLASCGDGTTTTTSATGTVSGTVTADGAAAGGVQIGLPAKGTTTTGADGTYSFTDVPAGSHTLTITVPEELELAGSEAGEKTVTVSAEQTVTVDWALQTRAAETATVDTVRLVGTSFEPSSLTIRPGGTVVWVNTEDTFHTVTPDQHSQWERAETSGVGEVTRATIDAAGTFEYYCEPHRSAGMTGAIVVQP